MLLSVNNGRTNFGLPEAMLKVVVVDEIVVAGVGSRVTVEHDSAAAAEILTWKLFEATKS